VLGGGYSVSGGTPAFTVFENGPRNSNRWMVDVQNLDQEGSIAVNFYAICGRVN
jgi:hypothetical protein